MGIPASPSCRNCGASAPGDYCPACGQETRIRPPTFLQFMREAGGRYVALDGRLWKTLGALLLRPGFLTREYFAGRRKRYIRPARLFLVASLVLFAALRIVVEVRGMEVLEFHNNETASPSKGASEKTVRRSGAPASADQNDEGEKRGGATNGIQFDDDMNIVNSTMNEFPTLKKRVERFNHLSTQEKIAQIVDGALRYGPYAMFALLPAFGLLLKILYLGPRRRHPMRPRLYSEHLVFAAHDHAFLFLAITAAAAAPYAWLRTVLIVWIVVYLVASLRVVYRGSWIGIALRSFVLFIVYSVLFGLATAGLVLVSVVLR